jgi:hypothetical protein
MSPLSHTQARELIQRSVDGLLQASQQRQLEQHLAGCAECRAYADQLTALEVGMRAAMLAHWPQGSLSSPAKNDLVKKLQSEFGKGAPPPAGPLAGGLKWLLLLLVPLLAFGIWTLLPQAALAPAATSTPTASSSPSASATPTASQTHTPSPVAQFLVAVPAQNVNCREGNGSIFDIADTLYEAERYTPNARGRDNLWVRFVGPVTQVQCWVFIENLELLLNEEPVQIVDLSEAILPFADYPPTPTPSPTPTFTPESATDTPIPQCSDGIDNDSDRNVDFPVDKDCTSANDDDESK